MNKITFMSELGRKLRNLPKDEFDDAMNYYNEYFLDAGIDDTADVIPIVGTPDEVSRRILDECTDRQIEKIKTEGGVKNSTRAIWYVILGIFAAPIAFPVAIAIFAVFLALIITAFALVFALFVTGVAMGLIVLGMCLVSIALGVLLCIGIFKLGELLIRGIVYLFSNKGSKKEKKERKAVGGESL